MKEILYQVGLKKITTGEKLDLEVWAENCDAATSKCTGLLGANGQYRWTGTGPVREHKGNVLERELTD